MRHPFVVLEGLSGVGKSTVCTELARELGGIVYSTPPEPFRQVRDSIDRQADETVRYLFYLAGVLAAAREIDRLVDECPVVCDRYLATTHCWHSLLGVPVLTDYTHFGLLKPDLTVLLVCPDPERRVRLDARGRGFNDLAEERDARDQGLLAAYRMFIRPLVEVDNTGPVSETTLQIVAALRRHDRAGYAEEVTSLSH